MAEPKRELWSRAWGMLGCGEKIGVVAKELGVRRDTVRRWMGMPEFQAGIEAAKAHYAEVAPKLAVEGRLRAEGKREAKRTDSRLSAEAQRRLEAQVKELGAEMREW